MAASMVGAVQSLLVVLSNIYVLFSLIQIFISQENFFLHFSSNVL